MTGLDRQTLSHLREDIGAFAQHLIGEPLWDHQLRFLRDRTRIRAACTGRQSGKTRACAVEALHTAFGAGGRRVLIVSAGEAAANDALAEITGLAQAPLLAGSVVDENTSTLRLSNGSTIRSVPASQRQVRGKAVDLLVIDEAAFVDESIWTAAKYTVLARPESKVILTSTPWGKQDRFFATAYRAGERRETGFSAHHWPSTASPLVDTTLLGMFRSTMTDREYRAEVLAEWVDSVGAYFSSEELEAAVALGGVDGVPMVDPSYAYAPTASRHVELALGIDWGFAVDANAVVGVGQVPAEFPFAGPGRLWVPLVQEFFGMPYAEFIEHVIGLGSHEYGIRFSSITSEENGVGGMPSQVLRKRAAETGVCDAVVGLNTTTRSKEDLFGALKLLFGEQRLVLPRHVELLKQLGNLEYEQLDGGSVRIAVPERRGHDDLVMALSFTMASAMSAARAWEPQTGRMGYYPRGGGRITWVGADVELQQRTDRILGQLESRGGRTLTGRPVSRATAEDMARIALGRPRRRGPLSGTR